MINCIIVTWKPTDFTGFHYQVKMKNIAQKKNTAQKEISKNFVKITIKHP